METDVLSSKPCNFHGDYALFSITNTFESRQENKQALFYSKRNYRLQKLCDYLRNKRKIANVRSVRIMPREQN